MSTQFEKDRAARIAEIRRKLHESGVLDAANALAESLQAEKKNRAKRKRKRDSSGAQEERRSSSRLAARKAADHKKHCTAASAPAAMSTDNADPVEAVYLELKKLDPAFPDEACRTAAEVISAADYTADQVANGALMKHDRLQGLDLSVGIRSRIQDAYEERSG
jgi:hypothetical protein